MSRTVLEIISRASLLLVLSLVALKLALAHLSRIGAG